MCCVLAVRVGCHFFRKRWKNCQILKDRLFVFVEANVFRPVGMIQYGPFFSFVFESCWKNLCGAHSMLAYDMTICGLYSPFDSVENPFEFHFWITERFSYAQAAQWGGMGKNGNVVERERKFQFYFHMSHATRGGYAGGTKNSSYLDFFRLIITIAIHPSAPTKYSRCLVVQSSGSVTSLPHRAKSMRTNHDAYSWKIPHSLSWLRYHSFHYLHSTTQMHCYM